MHRKWGIFIIFFTPYEADPKLKAIYQGEAWDKYLEDLEAQNRFRLHTGIITSASVILIIAALIYLIDLNPIT